eukprot:3765808-Pleurochrysis_carterae.AAC.1
MRPRATRHSGPMGVLASVAWKSQSTEWGFTQCASDPCVFTLSKDVDGVTQRLILGCYVDDLFTLYSHDGDGSLYQRFTADLASRWNVEDEGP